MNYYTAKKRWKDQILGDCYTCTKYPLQQPWASVVYRLIAIFCVAEQSIRIIFGSLLYNSKIPTYRNNNNNYKNDTLIIFTPLWGFSGIMKQIISMKHNMVKNPNRYKVNQLAILKA